jgi:radical SAM protein with 4Fe4S-binding SPASM domain
MNVKDSKFTLLKTKPLRRSIYLHTFKRDSKVALYHALNLEKLFGDERLLRLIRAFDEGRTVDSALEMYNPLDREAVCATIAKLYSLRMLVDVETDEIVLFDELQIKKIPPNTLKLLITNKCNFNCSYCQIKQNMAPEYQAMSMGDEIIDQALELFRAITTQDSVKTIIITGGEPMLNKSAIRRVVKIAPQKLNKVRIVLFTNGSLATKKWAQFLADNKVNVLVSIDGPPPYNKGRHSPGGKETFDVALQGYRIYKEAGCKVGISAVVGMANLEHLDKEVIEFFIQLEPESLGLNFPHYLVDKANLEIIPMEEYVTKLIEVYKIVRKHRLFIEQMSRKIIPFATNTPRLRECSASGLGLTVDARGYVGACKVPMVNQGYGIPLHSINKDPAEEIVFPGWTGRSPFTLPNCGDCFAISICGGGCAYDSWCLYGDTNRVDPRTCILTKKIFHFLLWDLYDALASRISPMQPIPYIHPTIKEQKVKYKEYFDEVIETLRASAGHQT